MKWYWNNFNNFKLKISFIDSRLYSFRGSKKRKRKKKFMCYKYIFNKTLVLSIIFDEFGSKDKFKLYGFKLY